MTARRIVLAVLAALLAPLGLVAGPASAQTPSGNLDSGGVSAGVSVPGGNGGNGTNGANVGTANGASSGGSSGGSSEPATSKWTRHYWGDSADPGFGTNAPVLCAATARAYEDVQTSLADGSVLNRIDGCEAAPVPGQPAPAPPPSPPTAAEVRNLTPLPDPSFGVSPRGVGLTGLPTLVWDANDQTPRVASSTIRGYSVTSTARPTRWTWDMADAGPSSASNPPSVISSNRPGSEDNPAGSYVYETRGDYRLRLSVTWGGSFVYSGNGAGPVTSDLGTTTRSSTRAFAVNEVRPVLVAQR